MEHEDTSTVQNINHKIYLLEQGQEIVHRIVYLEDWNQGFVQLIAVVQTLKFQYYPMLDFFQSGIRTLVSYGAITRGNQIIRE